MRLPILVSASPSIQKVPTVLLREGVWQVESNHRDSEVGVMFILNEDGHCETLSTGEQITIKKSARARAIITKVGTEQAISVDIIKVDN